MYAIIYVERFSNVIYSNGRVKLVFLELHIQIENIEIVISIVTSIRMVNRSFEK